MYNCFCLFKAKLNIHAGIHGEGVSEEVEFSKVENYVIIHSHNDDGTNDGTIMHDFARVRGCSLLKRCKLYECLNRKEAESLLKALFIQLS